MTTVEKFCRKFPLSVFEGTPKHPRNATIHGETDLIVATTFPSSALTSRRVIDRTGIFLLVGPDTNEEGGTRADTGSADSVQEWIKQGSVERNFWGIAIAVTTSDGDLSRAHVEYLEARLIVLAAQAQRAALDNGDSRANQRRRIPRADQAPAEHLPARPRTVSPVIRLDLLELQSRIAALVSTPVDLHTSGEVR